MWKGSPERLNVVEAETVPAVEGHVYAAIMPGGDAPPGSWITSRTNGRRRDPGGPTGSIDIVVDGESSRGKTEVSSRAEVGIRICS